MQLLPRMFWPSGFVMVTSLRPLVVEETFIVIDVGLLNVTLLTVTPPLTLACKRFANPEPGSKNPDPDTEVPLIVTSCGDMVTRAGTVQSGVAGGGAMSLATRTPYELVEPQNSWVVQRVMSSLGSRLVNE